MSAPSYKEKFLGKAAEKERQQSGIPSQHKMDPDYFSYHADHTSDDVFQNLSTSDYAKVIFCDLYYNTDSTVGCRFQITDHVHEDPCDYIGLFRVGYDNLSQCLAAKMLSETECEEDGKLLRCTFKPCELPVLENGFYQFLYVTRDNEVCGASMPFQIKSSITKDLNSDDDIVAENSEDDFLVVRSNMAEKNRRLQALLDEMTEKCLQHESEMRKIHQQLKIANEQKVQLEQILKEMLETKKCLISECQKISDEKNKVCSEKEEAIRILKEKNKAFSSMFDNYTEKLNDFTILKDALEADKDLAVAENIKLREHIHKLTKDLQDLQNEQKLFELEKKKNEDLSTNMAKETSHYLSQMDDAKNLIEDLTKDKDLMTVNVADLSDKVSELQEKLKAVKCANLVLKTQLSHALLASEKVTGEKESMMSEVAALKLHIVEMTESRLSRLESSSSDKDSVASSSNSRKQKSTRSIIQEVGTQIDLCDVKMREELQNLKCHCSELHSEVAEKQATIAKLKEELVKANGVMEYLTKEKESVQKSESVKQQALDECILRLNEASELYKKQFRKIEKLKKKLNVNGSDPEKSPMCMSTKDSFSVSDSADEAVADVPLPQNQNSDSDTGEHVLRRPTQESDILLAVKEFAQKRVAEISAVVEKQKASSSTEVKEVPELRTMIEMNLEKFRNSKSKEDEDTMYAIPCPVCDQDVGVCMSSTDEMVKHLEVQHKQQLCPVCGRLFDMTLPEKYFLFHVEDHFLKGKKK